MSTLFSGWAQCGREKNFTITATSTYILAKMSTGQISKIVYEERKGNS